MDAATLILAIVAVALSIVAALAGRRRPPPPPPTPASPEVAVRLEVEAAPRLEVATEARETGAGLREQLQAIHDGRMR